MDLRRVRGKRRGVALMLVLIAVIVAGTIAYSYVGTQSTSIAIARNIRSHARARYVAESGLELALAQIRSNENWRKDRPHGTWATDEPFGPGTFTIVVVDGEDTNGDGVISVPAEGDGDLADDGEDLVTIEVTGRADGASHVARAVVTPIRAESDLVGHWKLDETSGLVAADSSSYGNDGVLTRTSAMPRWEPAYIDGGLHLDGLDDFIAVDDDESLDLSDAGTMSLWFRMDSFRTFGGLLHKGDERSFSDEAYTLQFWTSNWIYFGLVGESGSGDVQSKTRFSNSRWYFVAASWDAKGMYVYVDGKLDNSLKRAVIPRNSTGHLNLGAQLGVDYSGFYKNLPFDGTIDDIRVYSRALSASEVEDLYNGKPPSGSGGITSVTPAQDTIVDSDGGTLNYGASGTLRVSAGSKALLKFDLSEITSGEAMTAARLSLYATNTASSGSTLSLYAIKDGNADWTEGSQNGAPAQAGEPCWDYLGYDTQPWAGAPGLDQPGVDFATPPLATIPARITAGQRCEWTLDLATVQAWIDDPSSHYGLLLCTDDGRDYEFGSAESHDDDQQPQLQISTGSGSGYTYVVDWRP